MGQHDLYSGLQKRLQSRCELSAGTPCSLLSVRVAVCHNHGSLLVVRVITAVVRFATICSNAGTHSATEEASMLLLNIRTTRTAHSRLLGCPHHVNKGMTHLRTQGGQREAKEVLEGRSSPPLLTAAATVMSHVSCQDLALIQQPDVHTTARPVGADECQSPGSKQGPKFCRGTTGRCGRSHSRIPGERTVLLNYSKPSGAQVQSRICKYHHVGISQQHVGHKTKAALALSRTRLTCI